jgi:hypothetical protein
MPQPEQAAKLANTVLPVQPSSLVAQRALGSAQRQMSHLQQSRQTLEPLAEQDLWSCIELAQTLWSLGEKIAAENCLRKAARHPATGRQRDMIQSLLSRWQVSLPQSQPAEQENIVAALKEFNHQVLDYPFHPKQYLSFEITSDSDKLDPVQPWWCTFKLTNIGPFTITLGPNRMVIPEILCTIHTIGDRERTSGPTIRISCYKNTCLQPEESIEVRQTLNIGPIRGSMIGTPQMDHQVEVSAILSPLSFTTLKGEQKWRPNIGGLEADTLSFTRSAFTANSKKLNQLISLSQQGNLSDRLRATKLLAMLLAEQQHLAAGRLRYAAQPLNKKQMYEALFDRLHDDNWQIRALFAETLRWISLDQSRTRQVLKFLNDDNWLVRGLILRALADHYGEKLSSVLHRYQQDDQDPWVRNLCSILLKKVEGSVATTQPE